MEQKGNKQPSINDPGWEGLDAKPSDAPPVPDEIDLLFQRVFSSEDGRKLLNVLDNATIGQPSWTPGADASHGYMREGQNSIVREIHHRIRRAQNV